MPAEIPTLEQHMAAIAKEYGYVAVEPIDINGVRAFNPGHEVPTSHVERGIVDKSLVARKGTKAADSAPDTAPPVPTQKG